MPELTDTDPRAREVWLELLRKMGPEERLAQALHLSELGLRVSEAGVRLAYPEASEREVFLRAAARQLPRETMIRAYGWDPESDVQPG
jgi:hypothetical protein